MPSTYDLFHLLLLKTNKIGIVVFEDIEILLFYENGNMILKTTADQMVYNIANVNYKIR